MSQLVGEGGGQNQVVDILYGSAGFDPITTRPVDMAKGGVLVSVDVLGPGRSLATLHQFDRLSSTGKSELVTRVDLEGESGFSLATSSDFGQEQPSNLYNGILLRNARTHNLLNGSALMVDRGFTSSKSWTSSLKAKWDPDTGGGRAHRVVTEDIELQAVVARIAETTGLGGAAKDEYVDIVMSRVDDMRTARRLIALEQNAQARSNWWFERALGAIGLGPKFTK